MEIIFENQSLLFICDKINTGLIEIDNPDSIQIVSDNHPDLVIKLIEIDLENYLVNLLKKSPFVKSINNIETICYDFIVFINTDKQIETEDDIQKNGNTLIIISLFELVINSLITNVKDWDLNTQEWKLIKI